MMKYTDARDEADRLLEHCDRAVVYVTSTGEWYTREYREWLHDPACDALGLAWDSEYDIDCNAALLATAVAFLDTQLREAGE